jgi:hypothetical protein
MQFVTYILLLHCLYVLQILATNYNIRIRNTGLRMVIFKEKKLPKILEKFRNFYELCYIKSVASVSEGINNLSEEERALIEAIISLCY